MSLNIKARFKNKAFVISFLTLLISFVYKLLASLNIVPAVSESEFSALADIAVNILAVLGVLIDPTTEGLSDSARAMTYYTDYDVREEGREIFE